MVTIIIILLLSIIVQQNIHCSAGCDNSIASLVRLLLRTLEFHCRDDCGSKEHNVVCAIDIKHNYYCDACRYSYPSKMHG